MYEIVAVPEQVVDSNNTFTGGLSGVSALYHISINSNTNIICYNISLTGFRGEYQSGAITATHIHEAAVGRSGPPRLSFPNPVDDGTGTRRSSGCTQGTANGFVTGIMNAMTGQDQGFGFNLKQIEDNPTGFFADVHSSEAVPGAVRGQFSAAMVPSASPSGTSMTPGASMSMSMTMSTMPSMSSATPTETVVDGVTVTLSCTKYPTCHGTPTPETPAASTPPTYGTGVPMPPGAPQRTGGYAPPPADGATTWSAPAGPTPTEYAPDGSQPTSYDGPSAVPGAAARSLALGGVVAFIVVFMGVVVVM